MTGGPGRVHLADGSLADSALTMDQALRNLVEVGLNLAGNAHHASTFPADYLGLTDRGPLEPGACADIVMLHSQLRVVRVVVTGRVVGLI